MTNKIMKLKEILYQLDAKINKLTMQIKAGLETSEGVKDRYFLHQIGHKLVTQEAEIKALKKKLKERENTV